jgi:hypothetical protein
MGMMAFTEDLLASYAITRGAAPAGSLRPRQPAQLLRRERFGLTMTQLIRMLPKQLVGLLGTRQFLMRTPEPLVPHQPQPDQSPLPEGYPASWTRRLSESQTAGIQAAARTLGVTLNDLLLRALFLTLAQHGQWHTPGRRGTWLRVCVPVNLRTAAQDPLPAANVVSMVFLDRRPRDMEDPGRLLSSIHDEMQLIKRLQLGLTFVLSLGLCQWLPGGLSRMCKSNRCMATGVLTNMGVLFSRSPLADDRGRVTAADVVLRDIDMLMPVRPLTCATVAAWSYAGRLSLTLHYDPRAIAAREAMELIDGLTQRVCQSAHPPRAAVEAGV